jgi:lantibiotic leader peptide-processing serine protease
MHVKLVSLLRVLSLPVLLGLVLSAAVSPAVVAQASSGESYIVLYRGESVPADAAAVISAAGGTLLHSYDAIGVAIARSEQAGFRSALLRDSRIENASATSGFGVSMDDLTGDTAGAQSDASAGTAAAGSDSFSGLQWDMRQIQVPQAHGITSGRREVLVGDIDSGLDYRHPDLVPNLDFSNSVSCVGGVPNQNPSAWDDDSGHGTHTAGTIAAAANGIGIVGTAPNVRIAAIKVSTPAGLFLPEAIVCAFMWAADRGFDVTNNSYYADPYLYNCKNDPEQHAIWKAEQRAIRYAISRGVTVVASAGNSNHDVQHPPQGNQCVRIPSEIAGVISVSAVGNLRQKSYYSNYSQIDVAAPGGDALFQLTPEAPNGRVLSTYPARFRNAAGVLSDPAAPGAYYRYLQGTSMAAPHVAGVAALIVSRFGNTDAAGNISMEPGHVRAIINQSADPMNCPANPYLAGTRYEVSCTGGQGYNSFYGHGQVNALSAIQR